jgi:16S rRNA (guanine(1405)-N(7))-methyltransferase
MANKPAPSLDYLVNNILSSPKYQNISPDLIRRIIRIESQKNKKAKDVIKQTKNKLHQIGAAYFKQIPEYTSWTQLLETTNRISRPQEFRQILLTFQTFHASTEERLPILDSFYEQIFFNLPPVHRILDIACGLNPLAIPWMSLPQSTKYLAWDIYADLVQFLNRIFPLLDCNGSAEVRDVLGIDTTPEFDVAFILKTLPCLEQVEKNITLHLLESIQAKFLVVSFPVRSLGGNQKGMVDFYSEHFSQQISGKNWKTRLLEFSSELVFLLEK